ncbi:MAG: hypothetical protein JRC93_13905 [Deltaproteobacteria bacterium]|nr:hypothetical protein [Deltaproteobacteria bacterium]
MKILRLEPDWNLCFDNEPTLKLLVDAFPPTEEMLFERKGSVVYAEHAGYVLFNVLNSDHSGYAGRKFKYNMKDGSVLEWLGPWSPRAGVVNLLGFGPCMDISITDKLAAWQGGHTFYAGHVTVDLVLSFLETTHTYFDVVETARCKEPVWEPCAKPDYYPRILKKFGIPLGWKSAK